MLDSLADLDDALRAEGSKLHVYYGNTVSTLQGLIGKIGNIAGIIENYDYTPFAKKRTHDIAQLCAKAGIEYIIAHDVYLNPPGRVLNKAGKPFQKFTPFYEASLAFPVDKPAGTAGVKWAAAGGGLSLAEIEKEILPGGRNPALHVAGGRRAALAILTSLRLADYEKCQDTPACQTSNLSAHNHFGTVSIREVYWAAPAATAWIRQLYWRDFYGHICDAFEDLYGVSPYDFMAVPSKGWSTDRAAFKRWATGTTGHDLVDAAMRQLVTTGYIHNRARLVAASYLAKELRIHWRWGEAFFARHLVDYDFAQNFGNWCWVASVLPFSSAPFRRLDPERQLAVADPDRIYVDRWLGASKK
jgi:deoxyribodipyrimidine photo-lyase